MGNVDRQGVSLFHGAVPLRICMYHSLATGHVYWALFHEQIFLLFVVTLNFRIAKGILSILTQKTVNLASKYNLYRKHMAYSAENYLIKELSVSTQLK